ncbi:MAG: DUF305 domain-containing protein [Candidatus Limnocylindrales bacterium]
MIARSITFLLLLTLAFVAGCSSAEPGSSGQATPPPAGSAAPSSADDLDRAFIDMMVPHHQSAIEMAKVAQERATHDELRSLADDIVSAQETEITQLREWRQAWFGSADTPGMDAMPLMPGMDMPGMDGMSMDGTMDMTIDVEALRTAEPFDRAFIEAMIAHHESAIEAAGIIGAASDRPELQQIAASIIEAQQREIDQMQGWRIAWYPS